MSALLGLALWLAMPMVAIAEDKKNSDREGGIIGTGIVGTITELGSIIVNGQRIEFDDDMMAGSVLGELHAQSLRPGQTVAVVAEAMPSDWRAKTIEAHYPLVGPLDLENGRTFILGTPVDLSAVETNGLAVGDWVAIGGLWKGNTVIASAVTAVPEGNSAVISGTFMPSNAKDQFVVGSSIVTGLDPSHIEPGDVVTVTGKATETGIAAETVRVGLFSSQMKAIIAEGYMSAPMPDGLYTILGSGVVSYTNEPAMIDTESVGLYCISASGSAPSYVIEALEAKVACVGS